MYSRSHSGDDKVKRRQQLLRKRTMDTSVLEDLRGRILTCLIYCIAQNFDGENIDEFDDQLAISKKNFQYFLIV